MAQLIRPTAPYEKVGYGNHSEVYRRPGSRWCIQVFKPDCPELTVDKVLREYAYLLMAYADMPNLIPGQRLFVPHTGAHISQTLLVKRWVSVDTSLPLNRITRPDLTRPATTRPTSSSRSPAICYGRRRSERPCYPTSSILD